MNIRKKLIWLPGMVLMLSMVIGLGLLSLYFSSEKIEATIASMEDEALLLSHLAYVQENGNDPEVVHRRFNSIAVELGSLKHACVYRSNVLTHQWSDGTHPECPRPDELHQARPLSTPFWDWLITIHRYLTGVSMETMNIHFENDKIVRSGPVKNIDGHELWVHMEYRLSDIEEMAEELGSTILVITLVTLVLVGLGAAAIYQTVLQPLRTMEKTAMSIATHRDFSQRLPENGNDDEFSHVNKAFNRMFEEIESTQRELVIAREKAEAANKHKSGFLSNVTQELKVPVHGILNFSAMGIEESAAQNQPKLQEHFEDIQRSGKRLNHLVTDLLEFSRLSTGKVSFSCDAISVHQVLEEAGRLMHVLSEKKNVTLAVTANAQLPDAMLYVDRFRMLQVLSNLLTNAIRFSSAGDRIGLTWHAATLGNKPAIAITVQDEGPGIPEDELERVFEHFIQGRNARADEGSGLGLTICRQIISSFGGTITARNAAGGGAILEIILPLANSTPQSLA